MVDGHLNFDTQVSTKGFNKGVSNINKAASGLTNTMVKLGGAIAAAFSIRAIAAFAKESKQLYDTQLEAEARLERVLKNTTGATEEQIKAVKNYSSALQEMGVIGDEVQLSGLQELGTYIENVDSLKTMNRVLNDMLAQQYGLNATAESAVTISTMLGKVLEGQTSALSRYGYSFTEAQEELLKYGTEEQRVATLAQVVEASVGGMNEALANTPAGRMKQLSNTMGDIKEQFGAAVYQLEVLFLPALRRLADILSKIAQLAASVTRAFSGITGNQTNSTGDLADNAEQAAESYEDMAEAAQEAQEANENSLASFDQINKLSDNEQQGSSSGSTGTSGGADNYAVTVGNQTEAMLNEVDAKFEAFFRRIKERMERLFEPLRRAWDRYGEPIMQHAKDIFDTVAEHAGNIGNSILDWASGLNLDPLFGALDDLLVALQPFADNVGEGLEWFFDNVLEPLGTWTMEELLPTFLESLSKAIDGLTAAWDKAAPVLKEELWDKFLKPLAEWAGDKVIDLIEDLGDGIKELGESITEKDVKVFLHLAGAITSIVLAVKGKKALDGFTKSLSGLGGKLSGVFKGWNEPLSKGAAEGGATFATKFFAAVGAFFAGWEIGSMIREAIGEDTIDEVLHPIFDWFVNAGEAIAGVFTEIPNTVSGAFDSILAANDAFWNAIFSAVESAISFFTDTIPDFFSSMGEDILLAVTGFADSIKQTALNAWEGIKNAFSAVGTWFKTKFTTAWTNVKEIFSLDNVKKHFDSVFSRIKGAFSTVGTWLKTKFTDAWDKIKEVFSLDNIKEHFTNIVNKIASIFGGLADLLKSPVNAVIDLVNGAIDKVNSISVDIPDWAGGGTLGFNIPHIPRLAQGTVIPANYGEFLAVLGDNKREAEVVSPISAIKQAVMEAAVELGSVGGNGSKQPMIVNVQVDRRTIGQVVIDDINDKTRRNGRSPLEG